MDAKLRGGKRKGAGRKPGPERVGITIRITKLAAAKLNAYCAAKKLSQASAIERWALNSRCLPGNEDRDQR